MEYPGHPEVGVGAVVLEGDRILLVKRGKEPGAGKWSLPGGHLELGESIYDAAARELWEETGIQGRPAGVMWVDELVERGLGGQVRYHYVLVDILVEPAAPLGSARPGSDAAGVAVVSLREALEMELTASVRRLVGTIVERGVWTIGKPVNKQW